MKKVTKVLLNVTKILQKFLKKVDISTEHVIIQIVFKLTEL